MIPVIPEGSAAHGDDESDAGAAAASAAGQSSTAGAESVSDAVAAPPGAAATASSGLFVRRTSGGSSQSRDADKGAHGQGQGPLSPMTSPISMVAQVASAALVRGVSWSTQSDAAAAPSPPWPGAALPPPASSAGVQLRPLQATGSQSSLHAAADGGSPIRSHMQIRCCWRCRYWECARPAVVDAVSALACSLLCFYLPLLSGTALPTLQTISTARAPPPLLLMLQTFQPATPTGTATDTRAAAAPAILVHLPGTAPAAAARPRSSHYPALRPGHLLQSLPQLLQAAMVATAREAWS